jgi:hypothetical protein
MRVVGAASQRFPGRAGVRIVASDALTPEYVPDRHPTTVTATDQPPALLRVLAHGRANINHLCQQTGLAEETVLERLAECAAAGFVTEIDRNLYQITQAGLAELDRDFPSEAGFLQDVDLIHDAPTIKTIRLRGDRGLVEVQVDGDSIALLADTVIEILGDTHGDIDVLREALERSGVQKR